MTKSALYTAVLSASSLLLHSATTTSAFLSLPSHRLVSKSSCSPPLASSAIEDDVPSDAAIALDDNNNNSILQARNDLLALAKTLSSNSPSGTFLTRPADKRELQKAIQNLEAVSAASTGDNEKEMLLGDWTLIATASLPSSNIRSRMDSKQSTNKKSKGWFDEKSLFGNGDNPIQKSIRKTVKVTQRIRNDGASSSESVAGEIDRVDNVIEITPLDTLESIIPTESPLYNLLGSVNVNPLQVKKSKVVLVHKAEVESVAPVLRTKIAWTSSILNVAGSSQFLEPEGEDVFGVNNLLGEFSGAGTFDTPYVDGEVRVSRTSGPVVEQLRVFVRQGDALEEEDDVEETAVDSGEDDEDEHVGARAKKVVDAATSLAENAREVIDKDMESVTTALGDKMDDVVYKVQDAVEDDLKSIGDAVEGVQSAIKGEGGDVGEAIGEVAEAVVKGARDVRDIVEEDRVELEGELREAMDAMVADVQDSVEEDLEKMRDLARGADEEEETEEE
mmetsp:Transcript_27755/g.50590  ORF Transcript_27755/g.50590 Transcript_27755/m.50590 type:complete len:504 (-) Transcript_27755:144-1655(-)|eukprot:CAMPEP_0196132564 /NCGR_PEP_ID=MMETSP0910-20130528/2132_1 /TAXON_ID=49265 /ORGANISM="Thalassiosira rotula, Strain GSO102" /LENGTH=503 /DNA_ID=CAMNT_0041392183 /DNA_START=96 /DNA_END=1607 /DNA_ORIENTATION=-